MTSAEPTRLTIVTRPLGRSEAWEIERRSELIAFVDVALEESFDDDRMLEWWFQRRFTAVAVASNDVREGSAAALLAADLAAIAATKTVHLAAGRHSGDLVTALTRRLGPSTLHFLVEQGESIEAEAAVPAGVADALVPSGVDSVKWLRDWIGGRSLAALHSAASLIRLASQPGERIEFARLFSTGEPQRGLGRFLSKQPLEFSSSNIVEIL